MSDAAITTAPAVAPVKTRNTNWSHNENAKPASTCDHADTIAHSAPTAHAGPRRRFATHTVCPGYPGHDQMSTFDLATASFALWFH